MRGRSADVGLLILARSPAPSGTVPPGVERQADRRLLVEVVRSRGEPHMYAQLQASTGWQTLRLVAREFEAEATRGARAAAPPTAAGARRSYGAAAAAAAVAPVSAPRPDQYRAELQLLREMGFTDEARNLKLLHESSGSVETVLNRLMT